jgi:hypothetical protein
MKIAKLLVLSALLLVGSIAKAEVPDGVWTIPEPEGLVFTDLTFDEGDTHYYLYNPVAKMFFASGNDWSTRASIAPFGYEIWFQASTEEDAPEGSYEFWDDCQHPDRVLGYKNMFTDDGGSTWVDHADQANYSWSVTKVSDNTYRIQNVALIADKPEFDGKWIGWKGDYSDTRLYMLAEGEGAIDWKAVTYDSYQAFIATDAYAAYKTACDCYSIALSLKATLEEAESLGANIATQLAVYNNTASTPDDLKAANDALKAIINARKDLKKALDDAKASGFTATADYDAVFGNGDATAAELTKALEDLKAALVEWGKGNASVEHPADMSGKIKNPNFDNASSTGWSGDAPNMVGSGSHGPANVAEKWNATFDTYQDIEDLPAGVYALGAQTMWRGSWNDMVNHVGPASKLYVKVGDKESAVPFNYAYGPLNTVSMGGETPWGVGASEQSYTDEESGVTYYIPNDPSAFRLYAEAGLYDTKVLFGVTDGNIRIGVKNPSMMGDADNWSCFDTFTLTYYGAGSDAAQLYLEETIKNYSEMSIEDGTIFTESYLTEYNEALKQDISVSSFEEVATALEGIEAAKQAIDNNVSLWKEWLDAVAKAQANYVFNSKYQGLAAMDDLADYVDDMNTEPILDDHNWTNEELEAEIAKIADMIQAVIDESLIAPHEDGDDMTDYIKNPGFDEDKNIDSGAAEGWTIDSGSGGNITRGPLGQGNKDLMESALGYMNYCFEAWHRYGWDVWQEIENLPKGMYELNVQGYVRCEVGGYNRGDDINPDYPSPIYLYMNSAKAQFPSVYSESPADYGHEMVQVEDWYQEVINDKPFPNSMGGAAQCFGWDMYKMTAFGLIAKKGDKFRIGVRMKADQDWWCIWDNFKLTYREPSYDIVKPALEEAMKTIDTSNAMGSEVYSLAEKVIGDAYAAIENADANEMFDALSAIYEAADAIRASVEKFTELNNANGDLGAALDRAAVASIKTEAEALYGRIQNGIDNHTLETSEIEGLLAEITIMMNRVGIPADMDEASDVNPIECSTVIINPAYVDGNDNGWTGGAAINASACDAEKFNTNYNYYQVIQGLPEGTYQVTVQGYFRLGAAANDYKSFVEDPTAGNNSFLYAVGEGDTCAVAMMRLASQAVPAEELGDGWVWASEENKLTVPNSMTTAGDIFQTFNEATGKNYYADNRVTVKVGADGKLTIGLKKNVTVTDDWTIWTNWQLFYFGKNSALVPDNDPSGIIETGADKPVKVEYFNLGGIQTDAKGFVIKKETMSDGTVKTQTVIK